MTIRRVIDAASTKKRDASWIYDPLNPTASSVLVPSTAIGSQAVFIYSPTMRTYEQTANVPAQRSAINCYLKGTSETISFLIASGISWKWRRIVWESKDIRIANAWSENSSGGTNRIWRPFGDTAVWGIIFKGAPGADWTSLMDAQVDRQRVTIHSDRVRTLRSGNDNAHSHHFKLYYPYNKNLYYDEDENGGGMDNANPYAAAGRYGMGNVYFMDIFECQAPASSSGDALRIEGNATTYWHEK